MNQDTPEVRRMMLQQQREETQRRLEAKRDENIAKKKLLLEAKQEEKLKGGVSDPQLVVKTTAQNLVASMKNWIRLPRQQPAPTADEVSVSEKEIAALTVKLSSLAPSPEVKAALVDHIKQLLLRGKIALQDNNEENMEKLKDALKEVAEDLKEFLTQHHEKQAAPPSGVVAARALGGVGRTASSPAMTQTRRATAPSTPSTPGAGAPPAVEPDSPPAGAIALASASTPSRLSTPINPSTPSTPVPIPATPVAGSSGASLSASEYDDGSIPPPPTQDFATAMYEQQEKFPRLDVPWQLDYLCMQVALRGGCKEVGQLDPMLPERKLAPYDITYALGNNSWVMEKDYLIPLSLLKRYLWHLPSPTIPDRQDALDRLREGALSASGDVIQYVLDMPIHKRDVLCYLVAYIRKIAELRGVTLSELGDVERVFAPLVFRSSMNYNSRDNKMKIPVPLAEEVRFLHLLVRDLDLEVVAKKGARERARSRTSSRAAGVAPFLSSSSAAVPSLTASQNGNADVSAMRARLKTWATDMELNQAAWLVASCSHCSERPANWAACASECKKCGAHSMFLNKSVPEVGQLELRFKVLSGFQYEFGCNQVSDTLRDRPALTLEVFHNTTLWYQDFFYGKPHTNFLIQEKDANLSKDSKDGPVYKNRAVVSVCKAPEGLSEPVPVHALMLHEDLGYVRVVLDVPSPKKKTSAAVEAKELIPLVKGLPHMPQDPRIFPAEHPKLADALADFEQKSVVTNYKFGVLYQGAGQSTEEQMYNNREGSAAYMTFLDIIGEKVTLAKHKAFRGGLECRGDNSTGEFSVFSRLFFNATNGELIKEETSDCVSMEIMWHVATYLPFDPENPQQLHRKRHLGNDLVIVVFSESQEAFDPSTFASQFNHVWIVVSPVKRRGAIESYEVRVVSKTGVKPFRPFIPDPPVIPAASLGEWLLVKCVNAERAAMFAKDFRLKESRTRSKMMDHWEENFVDTQQQQQNSMFSWGQSFVGKVSESATSLIKLISQEEK